MALYTAVVCSNLALNLRNKAKGIFSTSRVTQHEEPPMATKKARSDRELIDTGTDKRYVRRNDDGTFKESDDVGRSLSQDVKKHSNTVVPPGQGDKGDQKRRKSK